MSKILTVFGATGNQGGSVVKAILANPTLSKTYKIRAVTRNVTKPAAVALKEQGCEVVSADMNDKDSIFKATEGSSVVFGVTNFWESLSPDVEIAQGKTMADAAKAASVDRFIFSSLPNVTRESGGKLTGVKHFDSKAQVEEYAREIGLAGTYVMPAVFMSVFLDNFRKGDDGVYSLALPHAHLDFRFPLLAPADDTGKFVAAALLNMEASLNQRILATAGEYSPAELVAGFEAATGEKARVVQISWEMWSSFLPEPVRHELTANFRLLQEPGYYVGEPEGAVEKSIKLVQDSGMKVVGWEEFVKREFKK